MLAPQQRVPSASQAAMQLVRPRIQREFAQYSKGGAMHLMHLLSLPGDVPMTRMPTQDMPKTATLKYRIPYEYYEPKTEGTWAMTPGSSIFVILGHPALHWMTRVNPSPTYQVIGNATLGETQLELSDPSPFWYAPGDAWSTGTPQETVVLDHSFDFSRLDLVQNGETTPSPIIFDGPDKYVYLPYFAELTVTFGVSTNPRPIESGVMSNYLPDQLGITVCLDPLTMTSGRIGNSQSQLFTTVVPQESASHQWNVSLTTSKEGWYKVRLTNLSLYHSVASEAHARSVEILNITNVQIRYSKEASSPYWKMNPVAQMGTQPQMGSEMRRTAASFLLTNTSSGMFKQGNIIASRLLRNAPGAFSASELASQTKLAKDQYTGDAMNGCYTYMAFDDVDEKFTEVMNKAGGFFIAKSYLDSGYMNVITVHNAAYATAPNTYIITVDIGVEFKGSLSDREYAVPTGSFADLVESRRINNATVYFHENPVHWSTISKYLHSMWGFLRSHATTIGGAASAIFPEAAPIIMPVAHMIQR